MYRGVLDINIASFHKENSQDKNKIFILLFLFLTETGTGIFGENH